MTSVIPTEGGLSAQAIELVAELHATNSFVQAYRYLNSAGFREESGIKSVSMVEVMSRVGLITKENLPTVIYLEWLDMNNRIEKLERRVEEVGRYFQRAMDRFEQIHEWTEQQVTYLQYLDLPGFAWWDEYKKEAAKRRDGKLGVALP